MIKKFLACHYLHCIIFSSNKMCLYHYCKSEQIRCVSSLLTLQIIKTSMYKSSTLHFFLQTIQPIIIWNAMWWFNSHRNQYISNLNTLTAVTIHTFILLHIMFLRLQYLSSSQSGRCRGEVQCVRSASTGVCDNFQGRELNQMLQIKTLCVTLFNTIFIHR